MHDKLGCCFWWPVDGRCWWWHMLVRGVTSGGMRGTIPPGPYHYGGAKWQRGRQMTAGSPNDCRSAEKSQQCHKRFLQYGKFASERVQIRTWGRQTCFLPRAPSNLVTPLHTSGSGCSDPAWNVVRPRSWWWKFSVRWVVTNSCLIAATLLITDSSCERSFKKWN